MARDDLIGGPELDQGPRRLPVQPLALGRGQFVSDRTRDQLVCDVVAVRTQEARRGQRIMGAAEFGQLDRGRTVGPHLAGQLTEEPRIAGGGAMAVAAHVNRGLGHEPADQPDRTHRCERLGVQNGRRPGAGEQRQQIVRPTRVPHARGHQDQQR